MDCPRCQHRATATATATLAYFGCRPEFERHWEGCHMAPVGADSLRVTSALQRPGPVTHCLSLPRPPQLPERCPSKGSSSPGYRGSPLPVLVESIQQTLGLSLLPLVGQKRQPMRASSCYQLATEPGLPPGTPSTHLPTPKSAPHSPRGLLLAPRGPHCLSQLQVPLRRVWPCHQGR